MPGRHWTEGRSDSDWHTAELNAHRRKVDAQVVERERRIFNETTRDLRAQRVAVALPLPTDPMLRDYRVPNLADLPDDIPTDEHGRW